MEHEAVFRFGTSHAGAIYRALVPEMESEVNPRSRAVLTMDGEEVLLLRVHADDLPALRASLNMWLRLVNVADEMQELGRSGKPAETGI